MNRVWLILLGISVSALAVAADLDGARDLHQQGRLDQALSAYEAIIGDDKQLAADRGTAANNACVIFLNRGLYPAALDTCRQAHAIRSTLNDPPRLARTLNNLAAVLEASGQYGAAMGHYREALSINEQLGDWESVAINLANLGVLASQTSDFGSALSYYDRVKQLAIAHRVEPWAEVQTALATINRGVVLEKIGAFDEALASFRSVDTTLLAPDQAVIVRVNTGVAYRNLGDPIRALREFDFADALIPKDDAAAIANLWLDRGLVLHLNLHDHVRAQTAYENALALADENNAESEKLSALYYLARLLFDNSDSARAKPMFQQALDLADRIGLPEGQWSALEGLARIELQGRYPNQALQYLNRAMAIIETTRAGFDEGRLRLEFFGGQRSVYALAAEAAWQGLQQTNDSQFAETLFQVSQRAKARELLSNLATPEPQPSAKLKPPPDELILEYFFGDQYLYLSVLASDGLTVWQLGETKTLREAVVAVHNDLRHAGQAKSLTELSATLVAPLAAHLAGHKRLRIAPDGVLFHLPFALLTADNQELFTNHVISYTPSASVNSTNPPRTPASQQWLLAGFGAVDPDQHASASRYSLPRLPGAVAELLALEQQLPGPHNILLGSNATETAFRSTLSGGATITHIATHTVFDDRLGPAIVLTPDALSDGLLFPTELVQTNLNTNLAVLAACSTAVGGIEDGRAISSLTGALLSAGADAVLATLWDVDDQYTAYFMQEFYLELRRGVTAAVALRNTKMGLRKNTATGQTPWAAFVLMGDTGVLIKREPNYLFLGTGLILLLAWWWLGRRRSTA